METLAETNRILQSATTEPKRSKKVKKKKHVVSSRGKGPQLQPKRQPTASPGVKTAEHYRLNLAEIPFVAGTVSSMDSIVILLRIKICKEIYAQYTTYRTFTMSVCIRGG